MNTGSFSSVRSVIKTYVFYTHIFTWYYVNVKRQVCVLLFAGNKAFDFKSGSFSWGAARNFQIFVSLSSKYILYSRPPVTCNVFEEIFLCTINCKNSRSNADLVYKKKVVKNSNRLKCGFILYFPSCIWLKRSIHWSFFPYPYVRYIFTE